MNQLLIQHKTFIKRVNYNSQEHLVNALSWGDLISVLQKEIIRLKQTQALNLEKEREKLRVYEELTRQILKKHEIYL